MTLVRVAHGRARACALAVLLLLGAGCASAPARSSRSPRDDHLGYGILLPAGPAILTLPAEQRFRFVAPDSILRGITSEDAASVVLNSVSDLRSGVSIVLRSQDWRESPDSADYDVVVFMSTRTVVRTEQRTEQVVTASSNLPRCDLSQGQRAGATCSDSPVRTRTYQISVPYIERRVYHVIRRRDDGAVKWWNHATTELEAAKASVARDLLLILLTPEG